MSWHIVLFNSSQVISDVKDLDETLLVPVNFYALLDRHFSNIKKEENCWEINGPGFSIVAYPRQERWQIYDSAMDGMIDLEEPAANGYPNFCNYVEQIKGYQ